MRFSILLILAIALLLPLGCSKGEEAVPMAELETPTDGDTDSGLAIIIDTGPAPVNDTATESDSDVDTNCVPAARPDDDFLDGDDCCEDLTHAQQCWQQDVEEDGVACSSNGNCAPGHSCTLNGFCTCESDADCNDGVCTEDSCGNRVCGPSFCNGYRKCSCWGGCEWWDVNSEDITPEERATDLGLFCCEGNSPSGIGELNTYFSADVGCGL